MLLPSVSPPSSLPSSTLPPSISSFLLLPLISLPLLSLPPSSPLPSRWYHGSIKRTEAEAILEKHPDFSFLVRNSESCRTDFSLSIRWVVIPNQNPLYFHNLCTLALLFFLLWIRKRWSILIVSPTSQPLSSSAPPIPTAKEGKAGKILAWASPFCVGIL